MNTTELAPLWRRSRRCESGTCVEVADLATEVAVRDSTRPDGPVLRFSRGDWTSFTNELRNGGLRAR